MDRNQLVGDRIFDLLCLHPYGLTQAQLMDKLYVDDPEGGPLSRVVPVHVHWFNKRQEVKRSGVRIHAYSSNQDRPARGAGQGYRVWIVRER